MIISEILSLRPSDVLSWVSENISSKHSFNWLLLAQMANNNAFRMEKVEDKVDWLKVSITIYNHLYKHDGKHDSALSLLNSRACLVAECQDERMAKDQLHKMQKLFFESFHVSFDISEVMNKEWKSDLILMRELRSFKNSLSIFKELDAKGFEFSKEIKTWLSILNHLP